MSPPLTRDITVCVGTPSSLPTSPPEPKPGGIHRPLRETRTSRPRPTNRSPLVSTVQLERSRDADLRAVRDNCRPKRATRAHPLFAPATSGPKPFDHRCSRRARSRRLPRMAHRQATPCTPTIVTRGSRHSDGWRGAEAPRHPPRSGSGQRALSASAQPVDPSPAAAEPPAPLAPTS